MICPSTRAFSATELYGSTLPIADSRTGTSLTTTWPTDTGTAGGAFAAPPRACAPRRVHTIAAAASATTTTATAISARRADIEWGEGGRRNARGAGDGVRRATPW